MDLIETTPFHFELELNEMLLYGKWCGTLFHYHYIPLDLSVSIYID